MKSDRGSSHLVVLLCVRVFVVLLCVRVLVVLLCVRVLVVLVLFFVVFRVHFMVHVRMHVVVLLVAVRRWVLIGVYLSIGGLLVLASVAVLQTGRCQKQPERGCSPKCTCDRVPPARTLASLCPPPCPLRIAFARGASRRAHLCALSYPLHALSGACLRAPLHARRHHHPSHPCLRSGSPSNGGKAVPAREESVMREQKASRHCLAPPLHGQHLLTE